MTARTMTLPRAAGETVPAEGDADPLFDATEALGAAREHVADTALTESSPDTPLIGLELEFHLVDLAAPGRRPTWAEVQALLAVVPAMPSGSGVTVEPGGQVELSTPPTAGIEASVAALRRDRQVLGGALAAEGFGLAPLGADPARTPQRINPSGRYVAMEQHFGALGCADAGRAMMTSTAALQVNLDAGPATGWADRVAHLDALGPVLVAVSAGSPLLGGETSGWRSRRQQAWAGIDPRRTGPFTAGVADPVAAWVDYALDAPVMLVADPDGGVRPVTERVGFAEWLRGTAPFGRRPTRADLDYHLTTLFPPVRPRGYLELRYLDALPDRWWPALAAIVAALADDPVAADLAAEHCEPVRGRWTAAAREGLDDPAIRTAALACLDVAARHCAPALAADVAVYADLIASGRTPGDELADRAAAAGALTVLEEEARA
ncbi:ergothioneine biosynthesis glutamate--cysteine ligase EgtA [Jatrophihabitans endophyticus]|uniref:ergothioneine biosynthesis glutamate--cysteine ligase EgtA n=1 Tax=Jatrophihabitans endophyticus TaxID=1206085 RepID=UPI0026F34982|nr:ergothioneine biosynthesis glutamate--cysteine ligase EgtA [Jatrophihabitans endophyticus]